MSLIISAGTALPSYTGSQAEVAQFARRHFDGKLRRTEQLMQIFANTQIDTRHFVVPLTWFDEANHSWKTRNDLYIASAEAMGLASARQALDRAGLEPHEVDYIIYVSTSGLVTPSMDSRLINQTRHAARHQAHTDLGSGVRRRCVGSGSRARTH